MAKGKEKKQAKNQTNKSKPKQKTKNIEPEIRVDFEEIATLDITNISDNDIKEKSSILTYAKKNPEYAAFIFTIISTVSYFILRAIAFLYYAGICTYYNVDINYINVINDSIIFKTITILIILTISFILYDKLDQMIKRHIIISITIIAIILSAIIFFEFANKNSSMTLIKKIIISIIFSILFVLIYLFFSVVYPNILNKGITEKIQKNKSDEINIKIRTIRKLLFFSIIFFVIISFGFGYYSAYNQKRFKTINDNYVVLYMNDNIAVCSPYTEENNCITINKNIHKNFSLSDIEFEIKEFEEVNW